jgi:hypothetical protein
MNTFTLKEFEKFVKEYEPKVNNRFYVKFTSGLNEIGPYVVKESTLPIYLGIDSGDSKPLWGSISLSIYDPISPSTSQKLFKYLIDSKESKIDFEIVLIGPVGDEVSKWIITDCKIIEVNFGKVNWDDTEPIVINMVVQPKNCILDF